MERAQLLRAARLGIGLVVLTAFACTAATPATSGGSPTASGTAAPTGAKVASLEITAQDYSFTVPESVPSGWTKITFKNAGTEIHHVQVFRGKTGVTAAQLTDAIKAGPDAIFKIATAEGGAGTIVPTSSTETYVRMLPGTYLLACFVAGADKVPHLAKGMVKVVTVTDQAAGAIITPPESESTVTLKDFTFSGIPDTLPAGRHVFRVANSGPQPHEANILQLAPGKTAKDVLAFFADPSGPPPFAAMGGVQGVTKGVDDAILVVDLKPGSYLAICNIPDPASGKPHSALGMIKEFTVK